MAKNRYNGSSGAYGTRFFDDSQYKDSFYNPIVEAQGASKDGPSPIPMNTQVSTQVGVNSNQQFLENTIGGQRKEYGIPTDMNDAIRLRNKSLQDGVDGAWGFYQEGINKQGSGGDIYSKFDASNWDMNSQAGVDMTSNFGSNLEVGKTLSANQTPAKDHVNLIKDLRKRIAGVQSNIESRIEDALELPDFSELPDFANQGYGQETPAELQKINASKELTPWEIQQKRSKLRASQIKMAKGLEPGPLRKPRTLDTSGLSSYDEFDDSVGTFKDVAIDSDFATDAMNKTATSLGESTKLGDTVKGIGGALTKAAPYFAAASAIGGTLSQMDQRKGIINNLDDSVDQAEGLIGNLANQDFAEERAMTDEYSERNRRIGEMGNLALGNRLDAVKGSNLNTGSIKRIKEDLTQDSRRSTDVTLAEAADTYEKKRDQYVTDSRDTRAKANEQLKQLKEELKKQQRQQDMAPFSLAADLGIMALGASNPIFAMGLSAMKNKAMS